MRDVKALIDDFFSYLTYLGNPENKTDAQSLKMYMDDECVIQSNSEVICKGIEGFVDYIERMQQKYARVSYSGFMETPIVSGNKTVLHFQVDCQTKSGAKRTLDAIAILTFKNDKISFWKEVFQDIGK